MVDNLATWLEEELRRRSWSMRELARRVGVSHTTIVKIVNGQTQPGADVVRSIARVFQVPPEDVFRRAGLLPPSLKEAPGENELVTYYRELAEPDRRRVLAVARVLWEETVGPETGRR